MMHRTLFYVLLLDALDTARAMIYHPTFQTSPAENLPDGINGWTPRPTTPPRIRGQAKYEVESFHELFKRSSSFVPATCGYINGDANAALTCGPGYACAYLTAPAPQYFGCCPATDGGVNFSECYYYSTCHDYNSQSAGPAPASTSGGIVIPSSSPEEIYCAGNEPYCNTYALTQGSGSTYQNLFCAGTSSLYYVSDGTGSAAPSSSQRPSSQQPSSQQTSSQQPSSQQPTSQAPTSSSYQSPSSSSTSPRSSSTRPSSSLTTSNPAGTNTAGGADTSSPGLTFAGASETTSNTASPTAGGGGGSKSNTGAIAGGVVGGVAGIALLGAAIGYLIYRKKKARVEPMREVSIYSNNYSQPSYGNNGGSYNGYSNPNYQSGYSQNY